MALSDADVQKQVNKPIFDYITLTKQQVCPTPIYKSAIATKTAHPLSPVARSFPKLVIGLHHVSKKLHFLF